MGLDKSSLVNLAASTIGAYYGGPIGAKVGSEASNIAFGEPSNESEAIKTIANFVGGSSGGLTGAVAGSGSFKNLGKLLAGAKNTEEGSESTSGFSELSEVSKLLDTLLDGVNEENLDDFEVTGIPPELLKSGEREISPSFLTEAIIESIKNSINAKIPITPDKDRIANRKYKISGGTS